MQCGPRTHLDRSGRGIPRGSGLLLLALAIMAMTPQHTTQAAGPEASILSAIGRLIVDDSRMCTGFVVRSIRRQFGSGYSSPVVVYENWLATAGHCRGEEMIFRQGGTNHEIVRIIGYSSADTSGFDIMLLVFFTYLPITALEPAFGEYPRIGDKLMLVGYGHNALMMRVGPLRGYDDRGHMEIEGYASAGNSGGPVLIAGTRRVVGIGIETTVDRPQGASSLYCLVAPCGVKPPYVAAHIDRFLGVANFRDAATATTPP